MLKITEFCLQGESSLIPFAVLVERESECHWGIATSAIPSPGWPEHVAESKDRRTVDAWAFECWSQWLSDIAEESPEARRAFVQEISASTPGVVVRRPRRANTSLTARVVAGSWEKRRLHNRAESLAARIAQRLAGEQHAHWSSTVQLDDSQQIHGDWIVENQPRPGRHEMRQSKRQASKGIVALMPSPKLVTTAINGMVIIRVIESDQVEEVVSDWEGQKSRLGLHYPYGIAVVRNHRGVTVTDAGCAVGDRFVAAETLAISVVRAAWTGAFPMNPASTDLEPPS